MILLFNFRPRGRPKKTWREIVEKDSGVWMDEADKGRLMTTIGVSG